MGKTLYLAAGIMAARRWPTIKEGTQIQRIPADMFVWNCNVLTPTQTYYSAQGVAEPIRVETSATVINESIQLEPFQLSDQWTIWMGYGDKSNRLVFWEARTDDKQHP